MGRYIDGVFYEDWMPDAGKPRRWATPQDMYNSFIEYLEHCHNNKIMTVDFYGKDAVEREKPIMRMCTIKGFSAYCDTHHNVFYEYSKRDGYGELCSYIQGKISTRNIEGAGAFALSPSIVSSIEGLVQKREISQNQIQTVVFHIPQLEAPNQTQLGPGDEDLTEGDDWDLI